MRGGPFSYMCAGLVVFFIWTLSQSAHAREFTAVDEAQWSRFEDDNGQVEATTLSPDGQYLVVHTERGLLETNRSQSTLHVYSVKSVRRWLSGPALRSPIEPVWVLKASTYKDAPVISHIRWLRDSSGFAFLRRTPSGNQQLVLADLQRRTVNSLTPEDQGVLQYAINSARSYTYIIASPLIAAAAKKQQHEIGFVGTGQSLPRLMFPDDKSWGQLSPWADLGELWAVMGSRPIQVTDNRTGKPLAMHFAGEHPFGSDPLALSPDGYAAVAIIAVSEIPPDWKRLYPPPSPNSAIQIRQTGHQDIGSLDGFMLTSEYALIDLRSGQIRPLTEAPTGYSSSNWAGTESSAWSADGKSILLTNTFVSPSRSEPDAGPELNTRPCVAVVDAESGNVRCLVRQAGTTYKTRTEKRIDKVSFVGNDFVRIDYSQAGTEGAIYFRRGAHGSWNPASGEPPASMEGRSVVFTVKQDLNTPPVLVASETATGLSRVVLDPNPEFKDIEFGEAKPIAWKDHEGRDWKGGLYLPPGFNRERRYPLVVQTHGFQEHAFRPSGLWPTGFAARQLAAAGIVVLQVPDCPKFETPQEAPCNVGGYATGVQKLIADGIADTDRVGIIGFSRTCFSVMTALTKGGLHYAAASITEGFIMGYVEYLAGVDYGNNFDARTAQAALGVGEPFGQGIYKWLRRSPEFSIDRVTTPLQLATTNAHYSLLELWEPYAALRYLRKPVDLIILQTGTHPLSNPRQIMASQTSAVDWFRFWLQGYEDSDPKKVEQYQRWEKLCDMQKAQNANSFAVCVSSKH